MHMYLYIYIYIYIYLFIYLKINRTSGFVPFRAALFQSLDDQGPDVWISNCVVSIFQKAHTLRTTACGT